MIVALFLKRTKCFRLFYVNRVVPALNRAAQNGFRGCLRKLEDLEIIKMADIDRDMNRDDQSQFDIAFGEDELR